MTTSTVKAPANIAFIKYWGRKDHELYVPRNTSISMNINACNTITTAKFYPGDTKPDEVRVKFYNQEYKLLDADSDKQSAMYRQISRLKKVAGVEGKIEVMSENNFLADAGIASSASGFAALTSAVILALGLDDYFHDKDKLSREVRLCGSSSAVRSILDGYVALMAGEGDRDTVARQIASHDHWDLVDVIAIVDAGKKLVSSSEGHKVADTSPYFETRIAEMQQRIVDVEQGILDRDLKKIGPMIELESISLHAIMMTSTPPAYYFTAGTMAVIQEVLRWRRELGIEAYFTNDAGANVHIITSAADAAKVNDLLKKNPMVIDTIVSPTGPGVQIIDQHLF